MTLKIASNLPGFKAALSVNQEVIKLYWSIGNQIVEKQQIPTWGAKLIEMLSKDLKNSFPGTSDFSVPNLKRMRLFAQMLTKLAHRL